MIFLLFLLFVVFQIMAGAQESPTYPMNVSLISVYSLTISDKLAEGVWFTNETGYKVNIQYPLLSGSSDNNATWNYNATDDKTEYWIYVSGSVLVDICNGAKDNLCSNPDCAGVDNEEIVIGNVTWNSTTTNDASYPSILSSIPMVKGYDNTNKIFNIGSDTYVYLRYWLDIPPAYPAYNYSTIYKIQAVLAGETCV